MRTLFLIGLILLPCSAMAGTINIFTGPKTGTYYAFGRDMASAVQDKNVKLNVQETEGSVANIKRINVTNASDLPLGIVQSDVLGFLNRSQNPASKQIVSRLRVLFPFYQEEVHVLARGDIQDFKELQGKRVAVGEESSGHMLTAVNLFALEQIVPSEIKKITPEEGVVAVLKGDLDAVILVGGKPMRVFKNMEELAKPEHQKFAQLLQEVHFIALNNSKFYSEYEPSEISPHDYNFVKTTIPTITVQALLVSLAPGPIKTKTAIKQQEQRCALLKKFAANMAASLPALKQSGHPKWKEVDLRGESLGWQKDSCVWGKPRSR